MHSSTIGNSQESIWPSSMRLEFIEFITKIESFARDLAASAHVKEYRSVESDLAKIINASTIFNDQVVKLNAQVSQTNTLHSILSDTQVRHDLRTPLNAILGYSEILIEDGNEIVIENFVSNMTTIHNIASQLLSCIDEYSNQVPRTTNQNSDIIRDNAEIGDPISELHLKVFSLVQPNNQAEKKEITGKLLIVDDNAMNCDVLSRHVERQGHKAIAVSNGYEALQQLYEQDFDAVLLDLQMPIMDGYEVLQKMRSDPKLVHIPVIMISAVDEFDNVVKCIELGAQDYLTKPFNQVLLNARINASLQRKRLHDMEIVYLEQIEAERSRVDHLFKVIFPSVIAEELKATKQVKPRRHENVAVFFLDLVGFTEYCNHRSPEEVVTELQKIINAFEDIALKNRVDKTKTIGDAFMATAGLLTSEPNPVLNCVNCGLEMIEATQAMGKSWDARVGIHIGPVVAGVVGKRQYLFDVWGDTVNTASRIESHGEPGSVYLSWAAWQSVKDQCKGKSVGEVAIKGKGNLELFRLLNE